MTLFLNLKNNIFYLFVSVCIAQYTAYWIQYPANIILFVKFNKNKGKSVERVLKKYGKSVEKEV